MVILFHPEPNYTLYLVVHITLIWKKIANTSIQRIWVSLKMWTYTYRYIVRSIHTKVLNLTCTWHTRTKQAINQPEPVGGSSQTIGGLHQSMSRFIAYLPLKNQSNILETDKFSEDRITVFREEASITCCIKPNLTSIFPSRETILIRLTDKTKKSSKPEVCNIIYFIERYLKNAAWWMYLLTLFCNHSESKCLLKDSSFLLSL